MVHGLLGAGFAVGILRAAGQNRALRWVGMALLAAAAVSIWVHPFFPMSSRWMERSFTDAMHGTLTFVWLPIIAAAMALSAVAFRGWFRLYAITTILVFMGFGAASGIAIQGLEQNDTPWAGGFERISAYALMAWFVLLAVTVMRRSLSAGMPEIVTDVPQTRAQTRNHRWSEGVDEDRLPFSLELAEREFAAGRVRLISDASGRSSTQAAKGSL